MQVSLYKHIYKILSIALVTAGLCNPAYCVDFMPPVPDEAETLLLSGDLIAVEEAAPAAEPAPEPEKKEKKKGTPVISNISIEGNKIIRNADIMNAMKMQ